VFGIGETELVIIVVFAFLLFGPDKLPGMGRTLGRVLRQFREASDGFTEVVQTNIMDPASEELEKSPKQRKREQAALAGDDAADSAVAQDAPSPKRETFAERKARLQAERKAAEEAAAKEASLQDDSSDSPAASTPESDGVTPGDGQVQGSEVSSTPARPTAADLYAHTGRRSSRFRREESAVDVSDEKSGAAFQNSAQVTNKGEEAGEA